MNIENQPTNEDPGNNKSQPLTPEDQDNSSEPPAAESSAPSEEGTSILGILRTLESIVDEDVTKLKKGAEMTIGFLFAGRDKSRNG